MTNTESHKSVAVDIATYNILLKAADQECRTVAMQIKWLVRNSNAGSPKPAEVPIISEVVKRRKKRVGHRCCHHRYKMRKLAEYAFYQYLNL